MFVYSFLEKIWPAVFSSLTFLEKNQNWHPIMFSKHFQNRLNSLCFDWNCSLEYDWRIFCPVRLFHHVRIHINFWRISCPVRLFHTVRLLGTQEYTCIVLWPANVLLHKVQWVPKSMTRNGYYWQVPASQKKLLLW